MSQSSNPKGGPMVWVGVDGGGTRATAVAIDDTGTVLSHVVGGAALVDPNEPTAGAAALAGLVGWAISEAGAESAAGLCCALAGAGRPDARAALAAALMESGVAGRVMVIGDAEAALHDAFDGGAGALLISGTGSAAWARNQEGRAVRAGGWGKLLGDEGSGYWLGLAALRAIVRAADGREDPTTLSGPILEAAGLRAPEGLIAWASAADKAQIAALTPLVIASAAGGDSCARRLVAEAARELARQADAVVAATGPWTTTIPLAFSGGLIAPGRGMRDQAWKAMQDLPHRFALREEAIDAARGAANIARGAA